MKKPQIKNLIDHLLAELQEEDIGISLFTTHYQNKEELNFFAARDKERVLKILERLSAESVHHKQILREIIDMFTERLDESGSA